jgi:hypothetical protein
VPALQSFHKFLNRSGLIPYIAHGIAGFTGWFVTRPSKSFGLRWHLRTIHVEFGLVRREPRMTKPIARDPMYRRRSFDADIIELCVRWYITYRLSRSRGDDGGAWARGLTHDDLTMGRSVCSRVREALESVRAPYRLWMAILRVTGRYGYYDGGIQSGNTWRYGAASTSTISLSKITARSSAAVRR